MKGISLPINVVVIIALAVLVLVVLGAFFGGYFGGSTIELQRERALESACSQLRTLYNCNSNALTKAGAVHSEPGDAIERKFFYCLKTPCDSSSPPTGYEPGRTSLCTLKGLGDSQCLTRCGCQAAPARPTTTT